jgi:hypothetical protein
MDGIGDHALRLAERLRADHNVDSSFIVCDPQWVGPTVINGFQTSCLEAREPKDLSDMVERIISAHHSASTAVLLQFAPYGYEQRGCPAWLIQGLQRLTQRNFVPLMTMFHELDAGRGKPWSSTFWLTPFQRVLIRRLANLSNLRLTNTDYHRRKLTAWKIDNVSLLPSFSTIGEPAINPPMRERRKQIVIFGRPWQRKLAYLEGTAALKRACELVDAERIIDIGDPIPDDNRRQVYDLALIRCGSLPAAEVSAWMHASIASFLFYPEALLTKSSIYASTCAHGTIPFVTSFSEGSLQVTELSEGKDFLSLRHPLENTQILDLQKFSTDLYQRYLSRSSYSAAQQIASFMLRLQR